MMSSTPINGISGLIGSPQVGGVGAGRPSAPATMGAGSGAEFSDVLKQLAGDAVSSLKSAEAASILGVKGQIATQDVVEAVMSAEKSLQTAIAVRDKVVAAYLDLSRMAI